MRLSSTAPEARDGDCPWREAGLCTGRQEADETGRMICTCAKVLMAPSPDLVLETFTDLGLTDEQIGRYFHIPTHCITALRQAA